MIGTVPSTLAIKDSENFWSSRRHSVHQSPAKTDLSDLWKLLRPQQPGEMWKPRAEVTQQQRLEMTCVRIKCMQICRAVLVVCSTVGETSRDANFSEGLHEAHGIVAVCFGRTQKSVWTC